MIVYAMIIAITLCLAPLAAAAFFFHAAALPALSAAALCAAGALAVLDAYLVVNRRLYLLLEREDWPALAQYLEDRLLIRGRYTVRLTRLLANTYLVLSDSPAVTALERKAGLVNPALVERNLLVFGAARVLGGDTAGALRFFAARLDARPPQRDWARWYYGFTLLLDRQRHLAAMEFARLALSSRDPVVTALSGYFLETLPEGTGTAADAPARARQRARSALPGERDWARRTRRLCGEIHAAAVSRYLREAGIWLYHGGAGEAGGTGSRTVS